MKTERTALGNVFVEIRQQKRMKLKTFAELLGVTPAFVSNVEIGRKPVPSDWLDKLINVLDLNDQEIEKVRKSIFDGRTKHVFENLSPSASNVLYNFEKFKENLSDEDAKRVADILSNRDREVKNEKRKQK